MDLSYLIDKIQGRIDSRVLQVSEGAVTDIEKYRTIVGQISGLRSTLSDIQDLLKKQREAERE